MCGMERLIRSIVVAAVLLALPALAYPQSSDYGRPLMGHDISISRHQVRRQCDGNTDDTLAFQATLNAAGPDVPPEEAISTVGSKR